MKKGLMLIAILVILIGSGCHESAPSPKPPQTPEAPQAPVPSEPPQSQGLYLELTEPQDETVVHTSPIRLSGVTSPDAQVSINGQLINVNEEGNFTAVVELEEGPNAIEVIATAFEGSELSHILTLIYIP